MAKTRSIQLGSDTFKHMLRVFGARIANAREPVAAEQGPRYWLPVRVPASPRSLTDFRYPPHQFDDPVALGTLLAFKPIPINTLPLGWNAYGFNVRCSSVLARHDDIRSMAHMRLLVRYSPTNRRADGEVMRFYITARLPDIAVLRAELALPFGANVGASMMNLDARSQRAADHRPRDAYTLYRED
jgi:hypothetical protein